MVIVEGLCSVAMRERERERALIFEDKTSVAMVQAYTLNGGVVSFGDVPLACPMLKQFFV